MRARRGASRTAVTLGTNPANDDIEGSDAVRKLSLLCRKRFDHLTRGHSKGLDGWNTNCTTVGSMKWKSQICTLNLRDREEPRVRVPNGATAERLNRAFNRLQDIQLVRNHRKDPFFGKSAEDRFIWRELLDLELQDVDEQIERISAAAGNGPD